MNLFTEEQQEVMEWTKTLGRIDGKLPLRIDELLQIIHLQQQVIEKARLFAIQNGYDFKDERFALQLQELKNIMRGTDNGQDQTYTKII